MESRSIHRDGTVLHGLWKEGSGVPLVVVPGVLADAHSFVPVVDAFDRPEPVLVVDRRGRGGSGDLGPGYSFATEVDDLRAWIRELDGPVHLVGWSYGATIAIETAALDPQVRAVVAYEPGLGPFGLSALPALKVADDEERVRIFNVEISGFPEEHVTMLRSTPDWDDLVRLASPTVDELIAVNDFQPTSDWGELDVELILGEDNVGTEPYGTAFARVADRLPRSRTTLLTGHGHLAHAVDPAALGSLIGSLLPAPEDVRV